MRRPTASRTSTAVAVVAAVVAVLAVMGGIGIGQTISSHGGTPSDVYMWTQAEPCAQVPADGTDAFQQQFEVADPSHVLAYFTFEWAGLNAREFGLLNLLLDGSSGGLPGNYEYRLQDRRFDPNGTVMWSFPDVPSGAHTVAVYAAVDDVDPIPGAVGQDSDLFAELENCALTVFVIPVAE